MTATEVHIGGARESCVARLALLWAAAHSLVTGSVMTGTGSFDLQSLA